MFQLFLGDAIKLIPYTLVLRKFDTVKYDLLIAKLSGHNFKGNILERIESYLTLRSQVVSVSGYTLLFTLFITDTSNWLESIDYALQEVEHVT